MRLPQYVCSIVLAFVAASSATAEVKLPYLFTHHMVLQRDQPVPVWGKAAAGEAVMVSFGGQEKEATADESGKWTVKLEPLALGEPRELKVTGSKTANPIIIKDVLVGDVWLCSGQSNMEWRVDNSGDWDLEVLAAKQPNIRLLRVKQLGTQQPLDEIDGAWKTCTADSVREFSAVGWHFGKQVQATLDVPVGLVDNSWGGSSCETWLPLEKLKADELYAPIFERWAAIEAKNDEPKLRTDYAKQLADFYVARDKAYAAGQPLPERPWNDNQLFNQGRPGNLYYARVAPLVPMAFKGAIWYQGESNASRAYQYREMFPLMIQTWREAWGQGDFPFYWVQLADFTDLDKTDSDWAELREAQTMTQDRLPNTGEAVIIDIGEANDIHPHNKRDVGLRLARLALNETYKLDLKSHSPRFESMAIDGGKATLTFSDVGGGLKLFDGGAPKGFVVAGEDKVFHPAEAKLLDKNRIEVSSSEVAAPVAVRYGWANNPEVNVYDSAWLPLTPFRTDDWPGVTAKAR